MVNPCAYERPLAPLVAAEAEGKSFQLGAVMSAKEKLSTRHEFLLVEGVGGLLVPLTRGYILLDLMKEFAYPVLLVARAGLGTVNHTLMSLQILHERGMNLVGVILNGCRREEAEERNPGMIEEFGFAKVLAKVPWVEGEDLLPVVEEELGEVVDSIIGSKIRMEYNHEDLADKDKRYFWHPFTQMADWEKEDPLIIVTGEGPYLIDDRRRKFIDGVSSLWVNVHGHCVPEIDRAVKEQLGRIAHSTTLGLSNPQAIELAEKLVRITPAGLDKVFYSDSGSEAIEIALKMSLQYWGHKGEKRSKFLAFVNAYHGDTVGAVSLGGMDLFHAAYQPLLFNVLRAPAPYCYRCPLQLERSSCDMACLGETARLLEENQGEVAAVVIEPLIQGAAGMLTQPVGFLRGLKDLCETHGVLFIADEVATGFGRTGELFACEKESVRPDVMALAKGLTGGYLPVAATMVTREIYDAFLGDYAEQKTFFHGHTYTGNPLGCAAALANIDLVTAEKFLPKVRTRARRMADKLGEFERLAHVGDIRRCGTMVGIELVEDKETRREYRWEEKVAVRCCYKARERGIIIRPLGNVIVLMPPLRIPLVVLDELLDTVRWAIKAVTEEDL
jgi:adenosylmethionine-8-amino-7-oxononanoate transaminase